MSSSKEIKEVYWTIFKRKLKDNVENFNHNNHPFNYIQYEDVDDDLVYVYFPKYVPSDNLNDYIKLKNGGFFCAKLLINKNTGKIIEYNFVYKNVVIKNNSCDLKIHYDKISDEMVCIDHPKNHLHTPLKNIRYPTNEIEFGTFLDFISNQFTEQRINELIKSHT